MSEYQTIAIPFETRGNRQVLTRQQIENNPYLADFIQRFSSCFEQDPLCDVMIFYPDGDAPQ